MKINAVDIITTLPTPYRIHLFNCLSKKFSAAGLELTVHFMAKKDNVRPGEWFKSENIFFKNMFWSGKAFLIKGKYIYLNIKLVLNIFINPPEYLIVAGAWSTFTNILITLFCLKRNQKKVCWFEINSERVSSYGRVSLQFKKYLLSKYQVLVVPGNDAVAAVRKMIGNKKVELLLLPNLIDESRFQPKTVFSKDKIDEYKQKYLSISTTGKLAIIPARHSKEKGIIEFIEGVKNVNFQNWQILLIGKGPLQKNVHELIQKNNLENNFICIEFISYLDMPKVYAISDLFILPSIWDHNPLTVIEAMHCSLPLLLSNRVGNFQEALGSQSENGWSFSPIAPNEIETACNKAFSATEDELIAMGKISKRKAMQHWDSNKATQCFVDRFIAL